MMLDKPTSTIHQQHGFPLARIHELAYQRARDLNANVLIEMENGTRYIVTPDNQLHPV